MTNVVVEQKPQYETPVVEVYVFQSESLRMMSGGGGKQSSGFIYGDDDLLFD